MIRKILGGIAVLAIAAVAAINMNLNSQKSDLSDLALANVEALAQENQVEQICCNRAFDEVCVRINNTDQKGRRHSC